MTVLDLCLNVDRVKPHESYDKYYEYWSVDKNGNFLFMTGKKEVDFFTDIKELPSYRSAELNIDYIYENNWQDKPLFIPYEELELYENVELEFDDLPFYEGCQKYPLVCVRGTCSQQCSGKQVNTYCFRSIPCTNKRPDMNCTTGKHPDFFDLLFDTVKWIEVCPNVNALVVFFDFTPYIYDQTLDFGYSYAFLIENKKISIIGDYHRMKALYEEYNTKYPTQDRQIEDVISRPEDNFYFKF